MLSQEVCNVYRELPISIIIFKDEKLVHINKHLLNMFSIDSLIVNLEEVKNEIYYSIFEYCYNAVIESDSDLFELLSNEQELEYKKRKILIASTCNTISGHTVFVLTLNQPEKVNVEIKHALNSKQETKLIELFTKTERTKFEIFSMYKGLHIRSSAIFLGVEKSFLIFKVSTKHLISHEDNNEYILLPLGENKNVIVSNAAKVDHKNGLVFLRNLQVSKTSALNRKTIRVKCIEETIKAKVNKKREYQIYDISLYSLSLMCKKNDTLFKETLEGSYHLNFTLLHNNTESEISVDVKIKKIMKLKEYDKVVLIYEPDETALQNIKAYMNFRQMQLLRELKDFVDRA